MKGSKGGTIVLAAMTVLHDMVVLKTLRKSVNKRGFA
jgi:hypothetical protein